MVRRYFRGTVAAVLLLSACGPDIPTEARGPWVQAVYDPARADLPTPNDLAMVDGKVAIAPAPDSPAADAELKLGFNGYDGFSTGSSPKLKFTGPLSAASLSKDTVYALDLGEGGKGTPAPAEVSVEYADCDHSISFVAPAGFKPGHRYLFAVRGGDGGLKGASGEPVAPSPAFHFLRAGRDLRQHVDAMPGRTRAEREKTAAALEGLRQRLESSLQTLEKQGLPRTEVAALWTFTATTTAELAFDPGSRRIPFPNDLLRDPATGLVSLPIDPAEKPESQALKRGFNRLDGFSTTADLTVDATRPLDRSSLRAGKTVRLFRRDTLEEKTDVDVVLSKDGRRISVKLLTPLRPKTPYVLVVAGVRDSRVDRLAAMPLASLLKLKNPLLDASGNTTVASLCTDTAKRLEPMRAAMEPVLNLLEASGTPRSEVSAAYTFTTQDIASRLQQLWAAPYEANLPLDVTDVDNRSPLQRGIVPVPGFDLTLPNVARVITGKMTTLDFLEPTTRAFRDNGAGVPTAIHFVLTLPKNLKTGDTPKVVVFGHGLMTERRLGLFVADRLAESGFATMAIDLPLHGERTACLQDSHCASGHKCAVDGVCMNGTKRGELARPPNGIPGMGPATPTASGQAFVDVANLFGARDHFRQAIVDLSAQTRLIRGMDWKRVTRYDGNAGWDLAKDKLYYVGISLGGIMGANISGADPFFEALLLNVGGAGLPDLMRESSVFGPVLKNGLQEKGIVEGSPEYDAFVNAAKWVLDEADPINLARFAQRAPLDTRDPATGQVLARRKRALRLHMANGDTVVPNTATLRLVEATGIQKDTQFRAFTVNPGSGHGFLANPSDIAYGAGQKDMADFLEAHR
ncbi:MAG: hypothetical protein ACK4N5_02130 [Myxococcales bacterium]